MGIKNKPKKETVEVITPLFIRDFPAKLKTNLKVEAANKEITLTQLIVGILGRHVKKQEKNNVAGVK